MPRNRTNTTGKSLSNAFHKLPPTKTNRSPLFSGRDIFLSLPVCHSIIKFEDISVNLSFYIGGEKLYKQGLHVYLIRKQNKEAYLSNPTVRDLQLLKFLEKQVLNQIKSISKNRRNKSLLLSFFIVCSKNTKP